MSDTRPRYLDATLERHRGDVVCRVRLAIGDTHYEGVAVGAPRHDKARLGTEAAATALAGMPALPKVRVKDTSWTPVADAKVLLVTCRIGSGTFTGTCVNRDRTPAETGARAVLDALNAAMGNG